MPDKQSFQVRTWDLLERHGVARFPGAQGRIPNFKGAEAAAASLAELEEWIRAKVVKANPDSPQLPVRQRALAEAKLLYMAVPRLADPKPFVELDPRRMTVAPRRAASIRGAMLQGQPVTLSQMRRIHLVVCGSVAVNRSGARIGKGGGFSDLEFGLLTEAGLVDQETVIVTTVHPFQILDRDLPETEHDFRVDIIVTPSEVLRCEGALQRRPPGIIWSHLDEEKIAEVPVLAAQRPN